MRHILLLLGARNYGILDSGFDTVLRLNQKTVARKVSCTIVVNQNGNRNFAYLIRDGQRWELRWYWTVSSLNRDGRIASKRW